MSGRKRPHSPSELPLYAAQEIPVDCVAPPRAPRAAKPDAPLTGRDTSTLPFHPGARPDASTAAPVCTASITTMGAAAGAGAGAGAGSAAPTETAPLIGLQIQVSWDGPKLIFTGPIENLKEYLEKKLPKSAHIDIQGHSGKTAWTASFARLWRINSKGALHLSFLGNPSKEEIMQIINPMMKQLPQAPEDAALLAPSLTLDDLDPESSSFIELLPKDFTITSALALKIITSFLKTTEQIQTERNTINLELDCPLYDDTYEITRASKIPIKTSAGFGAISAPFAGAGAGAGAAGPSVTAAYKNTCTPSTACTQ